MRFWSTVFVALAVSTQVPGAAQSSAPAKPVPVPPAPVTPWGAPDLEGTWDFRSLTPLERANPVRSKDETGPEHHTPSALERELASKETFASEEEAAAFAKETIRRKSRDLDASGRLVGHNDFWYDAGTKVTSLRTSLIVDPPDGKLPPLTVKAAQERKAQNEARRGVGQDEPRPGRWIEDLTPQVRCLAGGGPAMMPGEINNIMRLFQTKEFVAIHSEMGAPRIVPIDSRPHLPPQIRPWMGDARGHWEGRTLVVETTNFRAEHTPFRASTTLRLVERFTRISGDTLEYEVTIDDPTTWTKPWTYMVPMARTSDRLYEWACHEGNYSLELILSAAAARK